MCMSNRVPGDAAAGPEATGFEGNGINSNYGDLAEIPGGIPTAKAGKEGGEEIPEDGGDVSSWIFTFQHWL